MMGSGPGSLSSVCDAYVAAIGAASTGAASNGVAATCRVTQNTAAEGFGGGIHRSSGGTVTLRGANPSPIVVNNCQENCVGSVPKCAAAPVSC